MPSVMRNHLLWGYISLGVLAVSGLVMNIIVSKMLGVTALGVFNQSFAIYIISSQFAAGGVHYAVLRQIAQNHENRDLISQTIQASLLLILLFSTAVAVVLFLLEPLIFKMFDSYEVAKSVPVIAVAAGLFAINKCLLAAMNGLERMQAFSILQSLRYILIVGALLGMGYAQVDSSLLSMAFLIGEAGVLLIAVILMLKHLYPQHIKHLTPIMAGQLRFGAKGFISGLLLEANTRIDILMLGVFMTDAKVGIYSFPAIIAEGALQSLVVLRNIYNPKLAKTVASGNYTEVQSIFRSTAKFVYPGFILLALAALLGLYIVLTFILSSTTWVEQLQIASILLMGILAYSAYVPFDQILIQMGKPGFHSWLIFLQVTTNIVLNLVMIPLWGLKGAAIATALAFALNPLYLNHFLKRQCGFKIGFAS